MRALLAHTADESWDGPGMDAYDRYEERVKPAAARFRPALRGRPNVHQAP
jgi:hypothetical protein